MLPFGYAELVWQCSSASRNKLTKVLWISTYLSWMCPATVKCSVLHQTTGWRWWIRWILIFVSYFHHDFEKALACCWSLFVVQSNLGITTTEGTGSKWSYFSGGLICQVCFKNSSIWSYTLREPWHRRSAVPTFKQGRNWQWPRQAELANTMITRSECQRRKS